MFIEMINRFNPVSILNMWRLLNKRVQDLEREQKSLNSIVDILLSEKAYSPDITLGMNGQARRKELVQEIFKHFPCKVIVETGTFLGDTTGYLSTQFCVPVYSCELLPRYFHAATRQLRDLNNIFLQQKDSRVFLKDLSTNISINSKPTFFYLDAHWYEDHPLEEEIDIIASSWQKYIILIDDFKVPGDDGYNYDGRGQKHALTKEHLASAVMRHSLSVYFPNIHSSRETGKRRGCVVLVPSHCEADIKQCGLLRAG